MTDPTNTADIIDSRDVIARIDELEGECDDLYPDGWDDDTEESEDDMGELSELRILLSLQDEAGGGDWSYGEALIRDTYFKDYARQLAEDIGALENTDAWPGRCIDWDQAAEELQQDYTSVDYDGVEYWIRA